MATNEEIQAQLPPQPAAAASMPPYPEMILEAIEALGDPNGSNKSSIWKQIEVTYGSLPPAHSTLLAHHLNRMKSSGQLQFLKNNYLKPDPNAPPRRGRGRPPKPKTSPPLGPESSDPPPPSRPRGRPPKPSASPSTASVSVAVAESVSGRKRGRPPKAGKAPVPPPPASGERRGRGRPPKVKSAVAAAPVGA